MNSPKKILIVADDLAHFKATNPGFDQIGKDWEVHYSQSPADACFCVRRTKFSLIFVELQAGPVAGSDLIYDLRLRQPEPACFLIGPAMDSEILAGCARGNHQFLQKPFDAIVLQAALERAELVQDLLLDPDIQKLVAGIRIFPSRPRVYVEIMRELRSEHGSAVSVGELVAQDLAISTKLLQVINSVWFGLQQKVSSPVEAVLHLGLETTASLVLALEVFAQFDHLHPNYFAIDHVWKHCQTVADHARRLAEEKTTDSTIVRDAYTAGLLHDIGKLALSINIKEEYGGVLRLARQRGVPVWRAELETFGTTHAAVGAYLLAIWGLPAAVVQAVAGHHHLACSLPEEFTALTAVHLANTLEYTQPALRRAFQSMEIDSDYPPGLGLDGYFAPFAENSTLAASGPAQLLTA